MHMLCPLVPNPQRYILHTTHWPELGRRQRLLCPVDPVDGPLFPQAGRSCPSFPLLPDCNLILALAACFHFCFVPPHFFATLGRGRMFAFSSFVCHEVRFLCCWYVAAVPRGPSRWSAVPWTKAAVVPHDAQPAPLPSHPATPLATPLPSLDDTWSDSRR